MSISVSLLLNINGREKVLLLLYFMSQNHFADNCLVIEYFYMSRDYFFSPSYFAPKLLGRSNQSCM